MIAKIKSNNKIQMIIIQSIFLLLAIGIACGTLYINRVALTDSVFHFNRLFEVSKDIQYGKMPTFNINTVLPYGRGIPTFYPWVCLLIFTPIVFLIHNPMIDWTLLIFFIMIIGFETAFFSSKSVFNKNLKSFTFSLLYCLSTIQIGNAIIDCDIGALLSISFAPLVIFGWIHWMKHNQWKMMTIGLILILFSHMLSALIAVVSVVIISVCCIDLTNNKKKHLFTMCKCFLVCLLSTCIIWLPEFIILKTNLITSPVANLTNPNLAAPVIPNSLSFLIAPYLFKVWTFSDLVCLILSAIYWKKLSKLNKRFVLIALFYIALNFKWIKLFLILHTPVQQIQFMYRISFISHLLLSIVFTAIIVNILLKKWYIQNVLSLLGVLLVLNLGSVYLSYACLNVTKGRPTYLLLNHINHHHKISPKQNLWLEHKWDFYKLNGKLFNNKLLRYGSFYNDYSPVNLTEHDSHINNGIAENDRDYRIIPKNNGVIKFYIGQNHQKLLMPMTMYNNQRYYLKLDNKYINSNKAFNKKLGYVELHNVHKGWHKIQLITPVMAYRYVALVISVVGLGLLVFLPSKRKLRFNKIN